MPQMALLVDKLPDHNELIYDVKNGIYYAELDGYVSFFYYQSPGNGYAGREFVLNMKDGSAKTLKGPWSSNSASINAAGFGPCCEVSITDDPTAFDRGYTFYAAAVTIDVLREACKMTNTFMVQHDGYFVPSIHPTRLFKPATNFDGTNKHIVEYGEQFRTIKHTVEEFEKLKETA
jgi:hypothetical protein